MFPYDEQQVVAFQADDVVPAYQEAFDKGLRPDPPDLLNVIWTGRMVYDARDMGYQASRAKHLRVLRRELGLSGQSGGQTNPPGPILEMPRLVKGDRCLLAGDRRFHVRGVSAFRLAHMLVNGEEAQVDDYLAWCQQHGINWLRVFCSCWNMFRLHPSDGQHGLELLADRLDGTGMYIEAVAIADTNREEAKADGSKRMVEAWPGLDWARHVGVVGRVANQYSHLGVEGANEPLQKWQKFTPDQLREFSIQIPDGVPFTLGAADGPQDESRAYCDIGAFYQNVHCDRTRAPWGNVRHVREQQVLSEEIGQYCINSEPMNSKDLSEAQNFGLGALERVCQIGGVHHSDWGKACRLPNADERRAFDARRRGWDSVPETFWGRFANYGWRPPLPENPVMSYLGRDGDSRCYASVTGDEAYVVVLHGDKPEPRSGWRMERVDGIWEASVWRCTR